MRHGDPFASCDGVMDTLAAESRQYAACASKRAAIHSARTLRSFMWVERNMREQSNKSASKSAWLEARASALRQMSLMR